MTLDEYGLTPKQRTWCDIYLKSGNATDAARKAGYTNPTQSGKDNTRKQPCKRYIAQRMQPTVDRRTADADEVLAFLSATMRGEIKDQFGLDASLQDRIKAAQELMKRYAVADMRQQSTLQRLDQIFVEFRTAISSPGHNSEKVFSEFSENAEISQENFLEITENNTASGNAGGIEAGQDTTTAQPPDSPQTAPTQGGTAAPDTTTTTTAQPTTAATGGGTATTTTTASGPAPSA